MRIEINQEEISIKEYRELADLAERAKENNAEISDYIDQLETSKKVVELLYYMIMYRVPFDSDLRFEIERWDGSENELLSILRKHTLSIILYSFDSYACGLAELLTD